MSLSWVYNASNLPWKPEVGARNDITHKLSVFQDNKLENKDLGKWGLLQLG